MSPRKEIGDEKKDALRHTASFALPVEDDYRGGSSDTAFLRWLRFHT